MENKIVINRLGDYEEFRIVPLPRKRDWMSQTPDGYAYQCMPLNIANEYGWSVLSPAGFTASWNGSDDLDAVKISYDDEGGYEFAQSHFGSGILTIGVDFVVRTSQNTSLYVRGIPNELVEGVQPLDAIVETDWLPFTFTYNYKFIKPCAVRFEKGEPLFSFFPIRRGEIESYNISSTKIQEDEEFYNQYLKYSNARQHYLDNMNNPNAELSKGRYYANAKDPDGNRYSVSNHVKKIMLPRPE
jgi:hypothetical protein